MKKMLGLFVLGMSVISANNASALDVSVVGGFTLYSPSADPAVANGSAKLAPTFGALLGFGGMGVGLFSFETGLLSVGKKRSYDLGVANVESSMRAWEVPFLVRFNLLPIVSVGAGGYAQKYTGNPSIGGVESTYDFAGMKTTDFGVKLNARAGLPIAPLTSIFLDASYKHGLIDLSKTAGSLKNSEMDLLAGLNFGF